MKFNYFLLIIVLTNSQLFGFWQDTKFHEKLVIRYPAYKQRILKLNDEVNHYFKMISHDPKNALAQQLLNDKTKEFADLICEAARNEIKDQMEESEFVKI